jgi:hypothetical protein
LAAVVLPDNVLFEDGAGKTVRKKLIIRTKPPYAPAQDLSLIIET